MKVVGRVLYDADELVARWVIVNTPNASGDLIGSYRAIGGIADRKLAAGALLYDVRAGGKVADVAFAVETPRAMSRGFFAGFARVAFQEMGLVRVQAVVEKSNARARKFLKGYGFREEGSHRFGYAGKTTAISYGLIPEECRWLEA